MCGPTFFETPYRAAMSARNFVVVILDSRIKTKHYGRLFLEALPACRTGQMA